MHKLTDSSFTVKGDDDKNHTVKGGLFVQTGEDFDPANVTPDSTVGQVVFIAAPPAKSDK